MQQETLRAVKRDDAGSRPARRLRREGRVPAIVYGADVAPLSVSIDRRQLNATLHTEAGLNALINVVVDGGDEVLAVAREIQRDPVRGDITHLDLIQVSLDIEIEAEVHIDYTGTPVGVREEDGFVEAIETTVGIRALPTAIPSSIEVDITSLGIYDTLKVADLPSIEGVAYTTDPDRPLVTVLPPAVEEVREPVEGEELEEGAVPETAEGEAGRGAQPEPEAEEPSDEG
jgi:large subunit ribosomal protein L25